MRRPHRLPALLLSVALAACGTGTDADRAETPADTMETSPTRDMAGMEAYSDARFLRDMTAHHRMAVEMAGMAATMAEGADLQAMAATMAADQTREVDEMTALLQGMGEAPDTSDMAGMGHDEPGHMGMPMTMDELRAARPFDRAFLASMIGHHSTAITMGAEAVAKSTNADVQRLARAIITAQAAEVGRMQAMLDRQFPGAPGASADTAAAR